LSKLSQVPQLKNRSIRSSGIIPSYSDSMIPEQIIRSETYKVNNFSTCSHILKPLSYYSSVRPTDFFPILCNHHQRRFNVFTMNSMPALKRLC